MHKYRNIQKDRKISTLERKVLYMVKNSNAKESETLNGFKTTHYISQSLPLLLLLLQCFSECINIMYIQLDNIYINQSSQFNSKGINDFISLFLCQWDWSPSRETKIHHFHHIHSLPHLPSLDSNTYIHQFEV